MSINISLNYLHYENNHVKYFSLGLSVVKEIVKVHKGEIIVNSDVETYTEFKVILPINLE